MTRKWKTYCSLVPQFDIISSPILSIYHYGIHTCTWSTSGEAWAHLQEACKTVTILQTPGHIILQERKHQLQTRISSQKTPDPSFRENSTITLEILLSMWYLGPNFKKTKRNPQKKNMGSGLSGFCILCKTAIGFQSGSSETQITTKCKYNVVKSYPRTT